MAKTFSIEEKPNIKASFKISNEGTQNHNKLFNRDLPDQHPISSITGLEERLEKPTFPEMISGSGLQAPTSTPTFYGEKYLCRNEKKMYIAEEGWALKENVTNTATFDSSDGSVTGFEGGYGVFTNSSFFQWEETFDFKMSFKINSDVNVSNIYHLFYSACQNTMGNNYTIALTIRYGKIRLRFDDNASTVFNEDVLQSSLSVGVKYYLEIIKNGTNLNVYLSTGGYRETIIEESSFSTTTKTASGNIRYKAFSFGCALIKPINQGSYIVYGANLFTIGTVYLPGSYGDMVEKSVSSLAWVSYDIEDEKIYLDTTNNILFFYKNNILTPIGG